MTDLSGKRVLVTGGSRNLGPVLAEAFTEAGATVSLTYNESADAARAIVASGRAHHCFGGDLARSEGVHAVADGVLGELGGIDILVNNAGPWAGAPFSELPEADWDLVLDTNLKAVFLLTQRLAPGMREAGWGRVINVSAGSRYVRNHSIYGLAKDAVVFLTEELAAELGPEVTVNAVAPGQILESTPEMDAIDPSVVPAMIAATPLGRLVTREEVARVVLALCSPAFAMVTGATIPVDGGWRLHRV